MLRHLKQSEYPENWIPETLWVYRDIEYGDDLARQYKLFWDNHEDDNGRALMGEASSITGDYIYVPMSELSYIYGSVYNSTTEVDTPAYYGRYQSHGDKFAL